MDRILFFLWFFGVLFGLIILIAILIGLGYLLARITEKQLERRYKIENDLGRPRTTIRSKSSTGTLQSIQPRNVPFKSFDRIQTDERKSENNIRLVDRLKEAFRK